MVDRLIKKYSDILDVLIENMETASSSDTYPYKLDIENTKQYIIDLKKLKKSLEEKK